jgi:hypothetical protein
MLAFCAVCTTPDALWEAPVVPAAEPHAAANAIAATARAALSFGVMWMFILSVLL